MSVLLLLLNDFVHTRLSSFFLEFKKHRYIPKHIISFALVLVHCNVQPVQKNRDVICSDAERHMYVKANTEVWCFLVLILYWLISKDSRWATHQSCMGWRLFFFFICFCTTISDLVLAVVEQAGGCGREGKRMLIGMQVSSCMQQFGRLQHYQIYSQELSQAVKPIFSFLFTMYFTPPLAVILAAL